MILVTGGAGFIGSHLIDRLLERGDAVVCLDDFNDFYDPELKRANVRPHLDWAGYRLVEADIRDRAAVRRLFEAHEIQAIVHLAARAGVRPSLQQPLLYEAVNVQGTLELLECARDFRVGQFVFASSSSVYGANETVPFGEDDPIRKTVSPYAATKYAGELFCHTYSHLYELPITCLRFFTVYGPRQRPEMAIHKFAKLLYAGKPIPMYGDGSSARDYTYIDDIIDGLLASVDRRLDFEVINLGESSTITLKKLIESMEAISGRRANIQALPFQPGDVEITYADVRKAARLLGYQPKTPVEEGLKRFLAWYEQNQSGR